MKKPVLLLLAALICLVFVCCSPVSDREEESSVFVPVSEVSSEEISSEPLVTLSDYLAEQTSQWQTEVSHLAENKIKLEVLAEEDLLVYRYRYEENPGDLTKVKENLDAAIEKEKDQFQKVLGDLQKEVPTVLGLKVEYLTADGTPIFGRTFVLNSETSGETNEMTSQKSEAAGE